MLNGGSHTPAAAPLRWWCRRVVPLFCTWLVATATLGQTPNGVMSAAPPRSTVVYGKLWDSISDRGIGQAHVFALADDGKTILGHSRTLPGFEHAGEFRIEGLPLSGKAYIVGFHEKLKFNVAAREVQLTGAGIPLDHLDTYALTPGSTPSDEFGQGGALGLLGLLFWAGQEANTAKQNEAAVNLAEDLLKRLPEWEGTAQQSGGENNTTVAELEAALAAAGEALDYSHVDPWEEALAEIKRDPESRYWVIENMTGTDVKPLLADAKQKSALEAEFKRLFAKKISGFQWPKADNYDEMARLARQISNYHKVAAGMEAAQRGCASALGVGLAGGHAGVGSTLTKGLIDNLRRLYVWGELKRFADKAETLAGLVRQRQSAASLSYEQAARLYTAYVDLDSRGKPLMELANTSFPDASLGGQLKRVLTAIGLGALSTTTASDIANDGLSHTSHVLEAAAISQSAKWGPILSRFFAASDEVRAYQAAVTNRTQPVSYAELLGEAGKVVLKASADDQQEPTSGDAVSRYMLIIMDCSGSMKARGSTGAQKILEAKRAIREVLTPMSSVPAQWTLMRCSDAAPRMLVEKSRSVTDIIAAADAQSPSGMTPLYSSLLKGLRFLEQNAKGEAQIILLTDGENTERGGDPLTVAREIRQRYGSGALKQARVSDRLLGVHVVYAASLRHVHLAVVGFDVAHSSADQKLRALAQEADGAYYPAPTAKDLIPALRKSVALPKPEPKPAPPAPPKPEPKPTPPAPPKPSWPGEGIPQLKPEPARTEPSTIAPPAQPGYWTISNPPPPRVPWGPICLLGLLGLLEVGAAGGLVKMVRSRREPAWLVRVVSGPQQGISVRARKSGLLVGRDASCDLRLTDRAVSGRHCHLTGADGVLTLADLGSSNGTQTRQGQVIGQSVVSQGEEIMIGQTTLRVEQARQASNLAFEPMALVLIALLIGLPLLGLLAWLVTAL